MPEGKSFERTPEQPQALDTEWYQRFQDIGGKKEAYEYLGPDITDQRTAQRAEFEKGMVENPSLDYPKLNRAELEERDNNFLQFKKDVVGTDVHGDKQMETVRQVYRWRINEKLAETRMLKAAATGDMNRFHRYSQFLYGRPSPNVFAYTVNALRGRVQQYMVSDNEALRKAAQDLDSVLPQNLPEPKIALPPDQETYQKAQQKTLDELGSIISLPETQGELDAQTIRPSFDFAIEKARLQGWKTVINPKGLSVSANQEKKEISIPENKRIHSSDLAGLILHEVGTHALRRHNGERTKLMLLGLGLDRYRDDEGVTGVREQAAKGRFEDFSGLEGHLAVSLATGLDGTKRDFRAVHTIMQKHFLVRELAAGKDENKAREIAADEAWKRCVRTFRGTDAKTPGVSFNKDLLYREGNIDVWEVVKTNPDELLRFSVGKYDPANSRHIMILDQLGITDKDLQRLEK